MGKADIGILGASSLVGACLLKRLWSDGRQVSAFSRKVRDEDTEKVTWYRSDRLPDGLKIGSWLSLVPIWLLPGYFPYLERCGVTRVIALSSTSRFTKSNSSDSREQFIAQRLAEAEESFIDWAKSKGIDWCILRPTLIYGYGRDRNVSELIRLIRRYRLFPLLGRAMGLRQPVHADDLAQACVAALDQQSPIGRSYDISGGEILPYRQMIERIFLALGIKPRFISVPLPLFRLAIALLRLLPRYRYWSGVMAERMNRDLVFDHTNAAKDLGFRPRGFRLNPEDLPVD